MVDRSRVIAAVVLTSVMASGSAGAHDINLPTSLEELELIEVAEKTYVVHGIQALPDAGNLAFMSNTGVVVTDGGAVIIDSGGSREVAKAILERVAEITDEPVVAIFNTHVHGDHWLGNAEVLGAFPGIPVFAHPRAIERLANGEAATWQDTISGLVGRKELADAVQIPTDPVDGGAALVFGATEFRVHHTGHAHTDNDIMLELPEQRVVFAGDVIEYGRAVSSDVPADFSATGQIAAIDFLLGLDVDLFVPGHGPTGGPEIAEASRDFLVTLVQSVERHYEEGLMAHEMREAVETEMSAYADWFNFGELGRLISYVYLQVEEASWE